MECISTSFAPIIFQPESGQDWAQQHIFGEQLRLEQTKQPSATTTTTTNNNIIINKKTKQWSPRQCAGRTRHTNTLQIPSAAHPRGVQKPGGPALKTPVKTGERSREEWEALLTSSIAGLRGAYERLEPPPAPRRQSLGGLHRPQPDRPDLAGLDRAEVASRALQAAAGCHVMFPAQMTTTTMMVGVDRLDDADDGSSDAGSSGSEDSCGSEDAPATPCEEMQIDPRLFS